MFCAWVCRSGVPSFSTIDKTMKMLGAKAFWVVFRKFFIFPKEFLQKNQIKGWSSEGQTKLENLKSKKWKIREQWAKMSFVSRSLHAPLKEQNSMVAYVNGTVFLQYTIPLKTSRVSLFEGPFCKVVTDPHIMWNWRGGGGGGFRLKPQMKVSFVWMWPYRILDARAQKECSWRVVHVLLQISWLAGALRVIIAALATSRASTQTTFVKFVAAFSLCLLCGLLVIWSLSALLRTTNNTVAA